MLDPSDPLPAEPTIRDRILEVVRVALASVVGDRAVEIEPSGDPDLFPSLAIYDGGDTPLEWQADLTRRVMTLTIEGIVERGDGTEATAERNALHAAAMRAIMADETFGGLIEGIEDGDLRKVAATLSESRRLMFGQDLSIQFTANRYDPALPA